MHGWVLSQLGHTQIHTPIHACLFQTSHHKGSPHKYVRPNITTSGPLAVTAGRHPLLEALLHHRHGPCGGNDHNNGSGNNTHHGTQPGAPGSQGPGSGGVFTAAAANAGWAGGGGPGAWAAAGAGGGGGSLAGGGGAAGVGNGPRAYAANDSYMSEAATLHLIAGPNMAGKSTYLKQVMCRCAEIPQRVGGVGSSDTCAQTHTHRRSPCCASWPRSAATSRRASCPSRAWPLTENPNQLACWTAV